MNEYPVVLDFPATVNTRHRESSIRYRLHVSERETDDAELSVYKDGQRRLLHWTGPFARRLLASAPCPVNDLVNGVHRADKKSVQHLALVAASIDLNSDAQPVGDSAAAAHSLSQRLTGLRIRIPRFHHRIAQLLFQYPGTHFSADDAECLLTLRYPCLDVQRVRSGLNDLADWKVIQQIVVNDDLVFFDIVTSPHLHVYCSDTGALTDAPKHGIVQLADIAVPGDSLDDGGKTDITDNDAVEIVIGCEIRRQ